VGSEPRLAHLRHRHHLLGVPGGVRSAQHALFVPFHLVLLGIILRGAAFVFRAYSPQSARTTGSGPAGRRWGAVFGAASVMTPVLLGMCLGAVSSGGIHIEQGVGYMGDVPPWLAPVSVLMGALALSLCAYLAAVFLANETAANCARTSARARCSRARPSSRCRPCCCRWCARGAAPLGRPRGRPATPVLARHHRGPAVRLVAEAATLPPGTDQLRRAGRVSARRLGHRAEPVHHLSERHPAERRGAAADAALHPVDDAHRAWRC
jgi:hypothetical protein